MNESMLLASLEAQLNNIINFVEKLDEKAFKNTKETSKACLKKLNDYKESEAYKKINLFEFDWYTKHEPFIIWHDEITEKDFTVIDAQYLLQVRALRSMIIAFTETQDAYKLAARLEA